MTITLTEAAKKVAKELLTKGKPVFANTDGHLFDDENSARNAKKEYKLLTEDFLKKGAEKAKADKVDASGDADGQSKLGTTDKANEDKNTSKK